MIGTGIWIGKRSGTGINSSEPQYRIFESETGVLWRKGIRDGYIVLDVALTVTGFAGSENLDWENVDKLSYPEIPQDITLTKDTEKIFINWSSDYAVSIERSEDNINFTELVAIDQGTETYTDEDIELEITYYYKLRALIGIRYSAYSDVVSECVSIVPDEDALFDTRNGLVITDSINLENITISHFPVLNTLAGSTALTAPLTLPNKSIAYTGGSFTSIIIIQPIFDADFEPIFTYKPFGGATNGFIFYAGTHYVRFYVGSTMLASPGKVVPDPTNFTTNWYAIVSRHESGGVNGKYQIYKMGDSASVATATSASTPDSQTGIPQLYNPYSKTVHFTRYSLFAHWNSYLSDADVAAIINTLTFPATQPEIFNTWDGDVNYFRYFHNGIDGTLGWIGSTTNPRLDNQICNDDYTEYSNFEWGRFQLINGFTRRGCYDIPHKPDGTKGVADHMDDVEYGISSCIHNMTNSYLNFSGISDATIKAIFDKSNSTYWKVSIQSEDHYVDAGGGYYGLWHPSQLTRDFITTHAQAGHENHIFASLRTSGTVITGITAIRVYKINLT
jgi:hypothetical protein